MKKLLKFILLLLLYGVVFIQPFSNQAYANSSIVTFTDPNLEATIRTAINKPTGDILNSDVDQISILEANSKNISNLSGIENLTSLTYLSLGGNKITDVTPISDLANLRTLSLDSNNISDISSLEYLIYLRYLYIGNNPINDISVVHNFYFLKVLEANNMDITDISGLKNLTDLENLNLEYNNIEDISSLSNLSSLKYLALGHNHINNISSLSGLTNLINLTLFNNNINSIDSLNNLTNLQELYIQNNQVNDISPLRNLINLIDIRLGNNNIEDIGSLTNLTSLLYLELNNNDIDNITSLSNLTNLNYLSLYSNNFSDISPLSNLTNLQKLYISDNPITDYNSIESICNNLTDKDFYTPNTFSFSGPYNFVIPTNGSVTANYTGIVKDINNVLLPNETVAWAVYDYGLNPISTLNINDTGLLTISNSATAGFYVIRAMPISNPMLFFAKIITLGTTITPATASFDKNTSNQADITVSINLNGNTLISIMNGSNILSNGTDYLVSGNSVTIKKSYLTGLATGNTILTLCFSVGQNATLNITVSDSTPVADAGPGGGGGGGGGGGAEVDVPPLTPDNGTVKVQPTIINNIAQAAINSDDYKFLLDSSTADNGIKNVVIDIDSSIGSSTGFDVQLPARALTETTKNVTTTINTEIAKVTVPSNMFDGTTMQGVQNIGISVSVVDKSALSQTVASIIGDAPVINISATVDGAVKAWSNSNAPVTISIPYTLKAGENGDSVTVYYIDSSNNLVNMQGVYASETKMVTFTTTHFSKYFAKENKVSFTDLTGFESYTKYIENMASKGIIEGIGNNQYAPGKILSRAEFATLLVKMLKIDTANTNNTFTDLNVSDWYAQYINAAYKAGLIKGVGANKFAPNDTISTQDAALILERALKFRGATITAGSTDAIKDNKAISDYAKDSVVFTVLKGITPLDANGKFNAKSSVNRASAAQYIYNVFYYKD